MESPRAFPAVVATFATLVATTSLPGQTTTRISISSVNEQSNGVSFHKGSVSPDGRFVAFHSDATNLVLGDTNGQRDVFVRDRQTAQTTRVSVASSGDQGDGMSRFPSISADGRYVAFFSEASTLVPMDTNNVSDIFVHDRQAAETTRVSISSTGEQGNGPCDLTSISADGNIVAFASTATNLVPGTLTVVNRVYVHDRMSGQTTLVSVPLSGLSENGTGSSPWLSADGNDVAFHSPSNQLVPGDTGGIDDIFVRDRAAGQTTRVSVSSAGVQGNSWSRWPSISADRRYVVFQSIASNLVLNDTNGVADVFVHDRLTGETTRENVTSAGAQANGGSDAMADPHTISYDGRYVAFSSWATNLVPNQNGWDAIFVRDRVAGETSLVSVSTRGDQANASSVSASISGNGQFIVFQSLATNLVPDDANGVSDVFIHDRGPGPCPSDVGGDGLVNVNDLLGVIADWGPCAGCAADVTGDGIVNVNDLLAVIAAWGPCA